MSSFLSYSMAFSQNHFFIPIVPQSVLKADYNQASLIFPESSRGKQCMCNCFMFLILASIEDVSSWNKELLHKILIAGDFMYNSFKSQMTYCNSQIYQDTFIMRTLISQLCRNKHMLVVCLPMF